METSKVKAPPPVSPSTQPINTSVDSAHRQEGAELVRRLKAEAASGYESTLTKTITDAIRALEDGAREVQRLKTACDNNWGEANYRLKYLCTVTAALGLAYDNKDPAKHTSEAVQVATDLRAQLAAANAEREALGEKVESMCRENLISADIIQAEVVQSGVNRHGIWRDLDFIRERSRAVLASRAQRSARATQPTKGSHE